jgi:hypothetical protein
LESKGDGKSSVDSLAAGQAALAKLEAEYRAQGEKVLELQQARWKELSADEKFAKLSVDDRWKQYIRWKRHAAPCSTCFSRSCSVFTALPFDAGAQQWPLLQFQVESVIPDPVRAFDASAHVSIDAVRLAHRR